MEDVEGGKMRVGVEVRKLFLLPLAQGDLWSKGKKAV
jgi:hypothetical protein